MTPEQEEAFIKYIKDRHISELSMVDKDKLHAAVYGTIEALIEIGKDEGDTWTQFLDEAFAECLFSDAGIVNIPT